MYVHNYVCIKYVSCTFITGTFQDINVQGLFMLKFYDNIVTIEQSIIHYLCTFKIL